MRGGAFSRRQAEVCMPGAARETRVGDSSLGGRRSLCFTATGSVAPRVLTDVEAYRHQTITKQHQDDAREELARFGLATSLPGRPQRASGQDYEEYDESGFFPEQDPLLYVSEEEAQCTDYEECPVLYKRIAIRKKPASDGRVLGAACEGEVLRLRSWDETRTWRMLHFRLKGGWGGLVEAWVMVRHPKLGVLIDTEGDESVTNTRAAKDAAAAQPQQAQLRCPCGQMLPDDSLTKFCSNCGTPRTKMELVQPPSSEATAAVPPPQQRAAPQPRGFVPRTVDQVEVLSTMEISYMALQDNGEEDLDFGEDGCLPVSVKEVARQAVACCEQYEVVGSSTVAVRNDPSQEHGRIVGKVAMGARVDTFGWDPERRWRKVLCRVIGASRFVEGWMSTESGDRVLLQKVPDAVVPSDVSDDEGEEPMG